MMEIMVPQCVLSLGPRLEDLEFGHRRFTALGLGVFCDWADGLSELLAFGLSENLRSRVATEAKHENGCFSSALCQVKTARGSVLCHGVVGYKPRT